MRGSIGGVLERSPVEFTIRADQIVTCSSLQVVTDGAVTIRGSTIGPVAPWSAQPDSTAGAVVRYQGCTILPGLIDTHAHISLPADRRTYEEMALDSDELMALAALKNITRHLRSGVTTIRDNGGRNRVTFTVREAASRGYFLAPRLLLSGRPITRTGGHFHWCNGVADDADEIRMAVRSLVAEGADHIKIMASGGGTKGTIPYLPTYTPDELRAAVEAAHGLGRLTTAHCRAKQSIVNSIEAGLDCIEHAEFLVPGEAVDLHSGAVSRGRMEYDPHVGQRIAESSAYVSFTFQAGGYHTLVELRERAAQQGLSQDEQRLRGSLESNIAVKTEIFASLLAQGLLSRMTISTDAGPFDTQFGRLHFGLELAVQAGMAAIHAIEAVTSVAARACGVDEVVGTIESGKEADLLVVRGDPLANIAAIRDVAAVYLRGALVHSNATQS